MTSQRLNIALAAAIVAQILTHQTWVNYRAETRDLPTVPATAFARLMALGDEVAAAKFGILWLQAFDNQPGISIPFRSLDYDRLAQWLKLILDLDPRARYPLLAASRIYTQVPDTDKQKRMMEFIYDEFSRDPQRRWPWLAHVAILAKHRLNDQALALKYAHALADTPSNINIPSWARQAEIFLLADAGESESARLLVGGLLAQGLIHSQQEVEFLREQLTRREIQHQITPTGIAGLP